MEQGEVSAAYTTSGSFEAVTCTSMHILSYPVRCVVMPTPTPRLVQIVHAQP